MKKKESKGGKSAYFEPSYNSTFRIFDLIKETILFFPWKNNQLNSHREDSLLQHSEFQLDWDLLYIQVHDPTSYIYSLCSPEKENN